MNVFYSLILGLALIQPARAQLCTGAAAKRGEKFFVVAVGISNYDYQTRLANAEREVSDLAAKLATRGCIPKSHIYLVTGQAADHGTILHAFSDATGRMKSDDLLIFVFSGHGSEIDGESLLLPREAFLDDESIQVLRSAAISVTKLKEIIREKRRFSEALFLLDACRTFPPFRKASRITVVSASQPGQPSYEIDDSGLLIQSITKQLDQPKANLVSIFDKARSDVQHRAEAAGVQQLPTMVTDAPPGKVHNPNLAQRQIAGQTGEFGIPFSGTSQFAPDQIPGDHPILTLEPMPPPPFLRRLN